MIWICTSCGVHSIDGKSWKINSWKSVVITNALHTASKVGSVGALFLLNMFVNAEWKRFDSFVCLQSFHTRTSIVCFLRFCWWRKANTQNGRSLFLATTSLLSQNLAESLGNKRADIYLCLGWFRPHKCGRNNPLTYWYTCKHRWEYGLSALKIEF